jgi:hypothetical protein
MDYADATTPLRFNFFNGRKARVGYATVDDDLVVQVFPHQAFLDAGARVAKAFADTIGEAGLSRLKIEQLQDELIGPEPVVFVRGKDMAGKVELDVIFPKIFQALDQALTKLA